MSAQISEYEALILAKTPAERQAYGQRIVEFVGGVAGPAGPDGGIDGWFTPSSEGETIYFQVKLSKHPVSRDVVKLIRQTCSDNDSKRAILVSVRHLSLHAEKYVREHQSKFKLCHLLIADILTGRHFQILENATFPEAQELGRKLTEAILDA